MALEAPCWVIKIGSALLTRDGQGLDSQVLVPWIEQIVELRSKGMQFVLVSSGAIAHGMNRMGLNQRPEALNELQALAAIGQMGLIQAYESCFQQFSVHTAQVLLTHEDVRDRRRYLNARSTLRSLMDYGVVPVVNENDTVATSEIRLGDNDTLAGLVSNLVEAELLVILTDQRGLFNTDPRVDPQAQLVPEGFAGDPSLEAMAGGSGRLGQGGMVTKLKAAELAARSGTATRIVSGTEPDIIRQLAAGQSHGTLIKADRAPMTARKRWLAGHVQVRGRLILDAGAVQVLMSAGRSLLSVGVARIEGEFSRGEVVTCVAPDGKEIARGLVNYDAAESQRILGKASGEIQSILGYAREPELIHRDNLVLMKNSEPI